MKTREQIKRETRGFVFFIICLCAMFCALAISQGA